MDDLRTHLAMGVWWKTREITFQNFYKGTPSVCSAIWRLVFSGGSLFFGGHVSYLAYQGGETPARREG